MSEAPSSREIEQAFLHFQRAFAGSLESFDGSARFGTDEWERPGGGGGVSRVLAGSGPIEKAAVNFSAVSGPVPDQLSERLAAESSSFYATGVSIIVHPSNPYAPTFHANVRYFETDDGISWFGGGADLTPCYLFDEDAVHFHRTLHSVCSRHITADYEAWKQACDGYFRLRHRGEARGVGGIFFDHLTESRSETWAFQLDLMDNLTEAYLPILARRSVTSYGERQRQWQEYRRGRYVEFNLVWDRGTRFGLETGGRTESILASLPPRVRFDYGYAPEPGSAEAEMAEFVKAPPRRWIP